MRLVFFCSTIRVVHQWKIRLYYISKKHLSYDKRFAMKNIPYSRAGNVGNCANRLQSAFDSM